MPTGKTGILYLQKDKLQLYSPFLGSVLEFRFVPEIIRDLDVVNLDLLGSLIKVFVTNGKVPPSNLIVILCDNAYFVKDFIYPAPATPQKNVPQRAVTQKITLEDLQKQADVFIEHVPYDNVVSKTLPLKNGIKVCAVNQDLFESIKMVFEALGFTVEVVLPGVVLGDNLSSRPALDGAMVNITLQRINSLKQYNLLAQKTFQPESVRKTEIVDDTTQVTEVEQNKKPNKKRLYAMVGILFTLLIVLVIVYIQSQAPPSPPQQPVQAAPIPDVKQASTINTSISTEGTINPATQTQNLSVQIVNAAGSEVAAQNLQTQLKKFSFKSIILQTQSSIGTSVTVIAFSGNVTQGVRNSVLEEARKIKPDITVQERQDAPVDITIILGK